MVTVNLQKYCLINPVPSWNADTSVMDTDNLQKCCLINPVLSWVAIPDGYSSLAKILLYQCCAVMGNRYLSDGYS